MAKQSAIGSGISTDTLLIIGGGLLAYFGVIKPAMDAAKSLAEKAGLKADPAVQEQEKANNDALLAWKTAILKKQQPTKSEQEWKIIADTIYNDLRRSSLDDNYEDAGLQICRVQNDADFALLFTKFAKRTEYWFGINTGKPKDLSAFVHSNMTNQKIAAINNNYARKGIKFHF